MNFTVQCTLVQSAVLRSHVIRLSLSVMVIFDYIGCNSSKIISRLVSVGHKLSSICKLQHHGYIPKGTPQIFAGIGVG